MEPRARAAESPEQDEYYIHSAVSLADDHTRVLKEGDTFAIFDRYGDIRPLGLREQGLYHEGTRFLSRFELRLGLSRPLFLSSTVHEDDLMLAVDLTNPDIERNGVVSVRRGSLHILRMRLLRDSTAQERLRIVNYSLDPVEINFSLTFDADFADLFEVRGRRRPRRGERLPPEPRPDGVRLSYRGLDGLWRRTLIECQPKPQRISASALSFSARLAPKEEGRWEFSVSCETERQSPRKSIPFGKALSQLILKRESERADFCGVRSSNQQFNEWFARSRADLQMMITRLPEGPYPYAGVPWYSTVFGRDGLITGLETLWSSPEIARGVLLHLAATQARSVQPELDAEPGKILHETRLGEMAALGEIPFARYYGNVDSTLLFVLLAGAYFERTGDRPLIERLWPHIELALGWMDGYGDADGDGFIEYSGRSSALLNQGWKDSSDAIFHADGRLAKGPIALCEAQAYAYGAKLAAASLCSALGQERRGLELSLQARRAQEAFERAFWSEPLGLYALALDGRKRPCLVRSSNAGHALYSGIASPGRARRVASALLDEDFFTGWGIRTVSDRESRFNPMSYHNGSVWPHDNALIAAGLFRYGYREQALRLFSGIFEASTFMEFQRLPELFCGFRRRDGAGPTSYPVACNPQAWSLAAVFLMLGASLGLRISGAERRILFQQPILPDFLDELVLTNLRVDNAVVDLALRRYRMGVTVHVLRRQGRVEIVIVK